MWRWTERLAVGLLIAMGVALAAIEPSALASNTTNYSYDAWGRATGATYSGSGNLTTGYAYDPAGNRTQVATAAPPAANPVALNVAYASSNNLAPLSISGPYTSVAVVTQATHGTASVSVGTTIKYTPSGGYAGMDSFTYKATNLSGSSAAATVLVSVAPRANAGNATVAYGSANNPVSYTVTGSYSSIAIATLPSHGVARLSGASLTYSPFVGYFGSDSFTYAASDAFAYNGVTIAAVSAPAAISITVNPQPPVANAVSAGVLYNTANDNIPLNVTGGAPASVAVSTQASHGTATPSGTTITYTPATDYVGSDSFYYTATNAGGTSSPAKATITVNGPTLVVTLNCGSPPSFVCATGTGGSHTFTGNPITVTTGSGSYTYSWTASGDGFGNWTASPSNTTTTTAAVTGSHSGGTSATYTCTVTNTATGQQRTSNGVVFLWTNTN